MSGDGATGADASGGALRHMEDQPGLLAQGLKDYAIIGLTTDGCVTSWDESAERILGYSEEEMLGQTVDRIFTPEDAQQGVPQRELETAAAEGRAEDERWHVRKDGSRFWASGLVTPLRDESGAHIGFMKVLRDTTGRKQAELALQDARAYAQAIVDTVRESLVLLDDQFYVTTANRPFYQTFGLTRRNTEGLCFFELDNKRWDIPGFRQLLEGVLRGDASLEDYEVTHDLPERGRRTMLVSARSLDRDDSDDRLVLLAIEDITREKQIESVTEAVLARLSVDELLKELLVRIQVALAVDTVAVLLAAPEGDELVLRAARGLEEEGEQDAHIPIGSGFAGRIAADRRPVMIPDIEQADIVSPLLRQKGVRSLMGVPLLVEGRLIGVLHVGTLRPRRFTRGDVRLLQVVADRAALALEHARLFDAEREARAQAQQALRAREEFAAGITHDLKSPVTTIRVLTQFMERQIQRGVPPSPEQLLQTLAKVEAGTDRLLKQIAGLLDLSRLQGGQELALNRRETDLVLLALRVAEEHAQRTNRHAIQVDAAEPELTGSWDPDRLERVLSNLVDNAVKYSPDGGTVVMKLHDDPDTEGWVRLSVRDEGIGIPAADLPHIFQRFYRGTNVAGRISGMGIGLAGSRQIVEQHGGSLTVESAEGAGTTVMVRLPRG